MPSNLTPKSNIIDYISQFEDSREPLKLRYSLIEILLTVLCAVICGAEDCKAIHKYGLINKKILAKILPFKNGPPSYDVICTILRTIDCKKFESIMMDWTKSLATKIEGVIALDGKTLRKSGKLAKDSRPIHLVSAWSKENSLILGQIKTDSKSNEITALLELLDIIEVKGAVVTIDAMGCQKKIVKKIREKSGDYIVALKHNQETLYKEVKSFLDKLIVVEVDKIKVADRYNTNPH